MRCALHTASMAEVDNPPVGALDPGVMYGEMRGKGWLPDLAAAIPFPETGSVTVSRTIRAADIKSRLTVEASEANAVVQLFEPTNRHILSVYVAANNGSPYRPRPALFEFG